MKPAIHGIFALVLGHMAIPQAAAATLACLPVETGDENTPIIHARINDGPSFAFVLDTAASGTTLAPTRAEALALPRDTATEEAQGMGGAISVYFHRVHSFKAGPVELRDIIVPALPAPAFESHDVAGLAGADLFADRLAIWRPGARCVDLLSSGTDPAAGTWQPVEVKWLQPWKIMLPVRIDGVSGWALLDTGAQYTTLNPAFANAVGLTNDRLRPGGSITGIDGRELRLQEGDVGGVVLGPRHWRERRVRVGDLPVFARLGAAGDKLAILGMDWLASEGFAIDYGRQAVWLLRPPAD
jgi:hypothetical protein